ncbi:MAG: hypothetical protein ACP6IS_05045 [Candidatus Asgardarchaeia archaeon]
MNEKEDFLKSNKCPECGGIIVYHEGEYKCSECGLVIENKTLDEKNPVSFNEGAFRNFSSFKSLGSTISFSDIFKIEREKEKHNERKYKESMKIYWGVLRENTLSFSYSSTQVKTYRVLEKLCSMLGIPKSIQKEVLYVYQKVVKLARKEKKSYLFKNHVRLIAALLLIVLRKNRNMYPISLDLLVSALKQLGFNYEKRMIVSEISKLIQFYGFKLKTPNMEVYFEANLKKLRISKVLREKLLNKSINVDDFFSKAHNIGRQILSKVIHESTKGYNPFLMAAAITYASLKIVARRNNKSSLVTQALIGKIIGVPSYSIRDHYLIIKELITLEK